MARVSYSKAVMEYLLGIMCSPSLECISLVELMDFLKKLFPHSEFHLYKKTKYRKAFKTMQK